MNKLMSAVLGLSLLVPVASFAQDTGGSKKIAATAKEPGKIRTLEKKGHKGGKKGKKGTTTTSTTPPAK